MAYYSSVNISDKSAIQSKISSSLSIAGAASIYSASASAARALHGITTREELIANCVGWLMSDEVLNIGTSPSATWSKFWGPGGGGSNICNVFEPSCLNNLRIFFNDTTESTGIDSYGIDYSRVQNISRLAYNGGSGTMGSGGGGGAPALEIEFMTGGLWGSRRFADPNFALEPVLRAGFMPARRPSGKKGFRSSADADKRATLHIMGLDGKIWFSTSDFILQEVQKMEGQVAARVSSMEGSTVKFVCAKDRIFLFGGFLMNMPNYDWARNWEFYWHRYLSGSTNAANRCRAILIYDDKCIEGYITEYNTTSLSVGDYFEPLNFKMYISNYMIMPSGNYKSEDITGIEADINIAGSYYRQRGKNLYEATADHATALAETN